MKPILNEVNRAYRAATNGNLKNNINSFGDEYIWIYVWDGVWTNNYDVVWDDINETK